MESDYTRNLKAGLCTDISRMLDESGLENGECFGILETIKMTRFAAMIGVIEE